MIGLIVYGLCVVTSALCAVLLLRGYAQSRVPLLLWSVLCFIGLTLNNVLLFVDVQISVVAEARDVVRVEVNRK